LEFFNIEKKYYVELYHTIGSFREVCSELNNKNISFFLEIPYHKYINTAFKKFHASMDKNEEIYFTKIRDVNNFADWLDGFFSN